MSLDQYFMSFKGHHAAFVVALLVLLLSTLALYVLQPKNDIRRNLRENYFSTDSTFGYRPAELYEMLGKYGDNDYKAHKLFIFLDLIYPLLYSISAAVMIGYLLPYFASPEDQQRTHYLTLVPLAAAAFDLLENLSMLVILHRHEANRADRSDGLACFSSAMTMAKSVLIGATLLVIVVGLAVLVFGLIKSLFTLLRGLRQPAA